MKFSDGARRTVALTAVAIATVTLRYGLHVSNAAIVSTTYLMVVLVVATAARLAIAVTTSLAAMLCLSSNTLAPRVIRTGARIAGRLGSRWYAVYVETPREQPGLRRLYKMLATLVIFD